MIHREGREYQIQPTRTSLCPRKTCCQHDNLNLRWNSISKLRTLQIIIQKINIDLTNPMDYAQGPSNHWVYVDFLFPPNDKIFHMATVKLNFVSQVWSVMFSVRYVVNFLYDPLLQSSSQISYRDAICGSIIVCFCVLYGRPTAALKRFGNLLSLTSR